MFQGQTNRWVIAVSCREAADCLVRDGLRLYNRHIVVTYFYYSPFPTNHYFGYSEVLESHIFSAVAGPGKLNVLPVLAGHDKPALSVLAGVLKSTHFWY